MSSLSIPVEEKNLQSIINGMDYINFKNEDELPTLTESYIKQMNDEYYRDKRKRDGRNFKLSPLINVSTKRKMNAGRFYKSIYTNINENY